MTFDLSSPLLLTSSSSIFNSAEEKRTSTRSTRLPFLLLVIVGDSVRTKDGRVNYFMRW